MINILALGGCGAVGQVTIRELLKKTEAKIVVGDLDFEKASTLVSELGSERVTARRVDGGNKDDLLPLLRGFDLLANYTNVRHHHIMLDAAIEAKINYIDLTGALHQKKLELDEKAKKAGVTAILAVGVAPGLTNLLAKHAANQLDEVEEIRIYLIGNRPLCISPGQIDSIMQQFFTEEKGRCYFENGKFVPVPPFSGKRVDYFPELADPQTTYYWAHAETSMLSRSIKGVKRVEVRGRLWTPEFEAAVRTFMDYNFFSKDPIQVKGSFSTNPNDHKGYSAIPRDCLREQMIQNQDSFENKCYQGNFKNLFRNYYAEVMGVKNGREVKILCAAMTPKDWGEEVETLSDISATGTGICAAIGTKMLAEGDIKLKGVLTPDMAIDPSVFFEKLIGKGFKIIEQTQRIIG